MHAEVGLMLCAQPAVAELVERRLRDAYADALSLLRTHRAAVEALADALLDRETLIADGVTTLLVGHLAQEVR